MGYSCTEKAFRTLSATLKAINNIPATSPTQTNSWYIKGEHYFYERGRENKDGSFTATVFKKIPLNWIRYGSIKINPEGKVIRWSGMPKDCIVTAV